MKNIIKNFLVAVVTLFIGTTAFAENFYIKNYNVDIVVNKNKQATVVETIDTCFTNASHGIIRSIPSKDATISGIIVYGENYSVFNENSGINIKIGNADAYVEGDKTYKIRYDYNYHDNKNEFYHNIIGTEWTVPIEHVSFKITLPEPINPEEAGLSIGAHGTKGFNGGAEYSVNGNIITGETQRVLEAHEGITFRTPVPDGYFNKYYNWANIITLSLIILLTVISFFTWFTVGKEYRVIPVVSFELPKNVKNVFEADAFFHNATTRTGIVALIMELANKGYLKIEQNKDKFIFRKLKNTDDLFYIEKLLLNSMFSNKDVVSEEELEYSRDFYGTCENILATNYDEKMYEKSSIDIKKITLMNRSLVIIFFALLLFITGFNFSALFDFSMGIGELTVMMIVLFFSNTLKSLKNII